MSKTKQPNKTQRTRYNSQFKAEALALAEKIGVAPAAKQLGLHTSQLYNWRSKAQRELSQSDAEQRLATENAKLKRQLAEQAEELAILKKAAAYFAKSLK
jgi:transposase